MKEEPQELAHKLMVSHSHSCGPAVIPAGGLFTELEVLLLVIEGGC